MTIERRRLQGHARAQMTQEELEVVQRDLRDTSEAKRAPDLHYRCTRCQKSIPSQPNDSVGCDCGNVFIDVDYHRLVVDDFSCFLVVRHST